jgi:hypothetical protein
MSPGDSFFKAYLTNNYCNVGEDEARIIQVNPRKSIKSKDLAKGA